MRAIHPITGHVATVALIVLCSGVDGCKSTSSGVGNPFLAPDRVPPPSTHALLPGQAQPYYQGDPLPSASQTAPSAPATAAAASPMERSLSPSGRTLAWNAPATAAASGPPVSPAPPINQPVSPQITQAVAAVNENSIAVPTDADPLRYALPQAPRVETAASPPAAAVVTAENKPTATQPVGGTRTAPSQNVLLASYNAPAAVVPQAIQPLTTVPSQQSTTPWRSPQLIQPLNSATNVSQQGSIQPLVGSLPTLPPPNSSPLAQQPVSIPTNTMAATLRAVNPPPPQPGDPMPRIRMPDYLPPPPISTADGFRPRTSMQ